MANGLPGAGIVSAMNFRFEVVLDTEGNFPDGIDVTVLAPGRIEALGQYRVPNGAMLVVIPPDVAEKIRGMKKQSDAQRPRLPSA